MKEKLILLFFFLMSIVYQTASAINLQDSNSVQSDSSFVDSSLLRRSYNALKPFGLADSLRNDTILRSIFTPYHLITQSYSQRVNRRLNLPTVKEVINRPVKSDAWKFWVITLIILYISIVRIINPNNFKIFLLSVFNLKLSEKIWDEQRSVFNFVILQLFCIYLFIAALFINYFLELKNFNPFQNYLFQYVAILGVIIIVYLLKFILHGVLGVLFKMKKLGIGFVSNTVSVNNFLSLVILPFIIFIIYNEEPLWALILSRTVIAIFFISVIYRMVRIVLLSHAFFSFPRIYLFIYLCALELLPWFIIVKFINQYPV